MKLVLEQCCQCIERLFDTTVWLHTTLARGTRAARSSSSISTQSTVDRHEDANGIRLHRTKAVIKAQKGSQLSNHGWQPRHDY
ncbi:hypothetical protein PsorP6_012783 [Peronosclerospora sorghi]|uniref:Uncharacterized protein n=1 Tax=Peronosclerospora sorghi TaxID=230839 RepID=A0ACC0WFQ1_9STRA|nr:hypothetical protein PsorP6_012783 [Peronosclerospora sorghi]